MRKSHELHATRARLAARRSAAEAEAGRIDWLVGPQGEGLWGEIWREAYADEVEKIIRTEGCEHGRHTCQTCGEKIQT